MARGTNSSKYIQSIGSQDVRTFVGFPAATRHERERERKQVRGLYAVKRGKICMHASERANSEMKKGHTIVFSQCVKWDKEYRFHTNHAVDANIGIFPYRSSPYIL